MSKPVVRRLGAMLREVVVIVTGVSLALAADALYDRRQDRAERTRILRSLDADLRADSVAYARVAAGWLDQRAQAAATLLAVVEDPTRTIDQVELARLVRESIAFPSGVKESATYREITATGGIGLIERPALREALLRYYAMSFYGMPSEMYASFISGISAPYEESLRRLLGGAYIALTSCLPAAAEYEQCLEAQSGRVDLGRLRADPDFVQRLVGVVLWAGRFRVFVGAQARQQAAVAEQVKAVVAGS